MKRIVILIFILLLLPLTSAVEFDMKTNFSQGETLMARISGNFIEPILKENIFFYRDHVRIPMDFDVTEIQDEFYIYAQTLEKLANDYSIVIKDVKYMQGSQISEEDIVKNFSITGEIADFSISPGSISTKEDFFIEVQNLQDYKITIQVKTNITENETAIISFEDEITLKSGEIKKINFKVSDISESKFTKIELSSENLAYQIPVYIFAIGIESIKTQKSFKFEPSELNISLSTNFSTIRIIYLYNTGNEALENISLLISNSLKPYVSLSLEKIDELEANSNKKIEVFISSDYMEEIIEGQITAQTSDEIYTHSELLLNFIKDYIPTEEENITSSTKTCAELGGEICNSTKNEECRCIKDPNNKTCEGKATYAKDDVCCLGICKEIKKSSVGEIIGWGIVVLMILLLIWFYKKKYRRARKPIDLLKIARGKKSKFPDFRERNPKFKRSVRRIEPIKRVLPKPIVRIVEKPVIREVVKKVFIEKPRKEPPKYEYVGSTNAKTYHKTSCRFSKLIKDKFKVSKNEQEYFQKQGYKPCKVCLK